MMLWIAFKSLYLWYSKQQDVEKFAEGYGCELLSKVYIFDIRNNTSPGIGKGYMLWIAFKSLYLWYSKQLIVFLAIVSCGCELLSKVYIFDIRNNL